MGTLHYLDDYRVRCTVARCVECTTEVMFGEPSGDVERVIRALRCPECGGALEVDRSARPRGTDPRAERP